MSGEFHWCNSGYFYSVLAEVRYDRPVTNEPVANAVRELLIALAPLECAVAWHEACDSTLSEVVLAAHKNAAGIESAMDQLRTALRQYSNLVDDVVRSATK